MEGRCASVPLPLSWDISKTIRRFSQYKIVEEVDPIRE
jgi:hypothetical protein